MATNKNITPPPPIGCCVPAQLQPQPPSPGVERDRSQGTPPSPKSLHWLGDRETAESLRHAEDRCGCVMYFATEADCERFMDWVMGIPTERTNTTP